MRRFSGSVMRAVPAALLLGLACLSSPSWADEFFRTAVPVWVTGRETEMNLSVGYHATFEKPATAAPAVLRVAAASLYRAWINGEFLGHGPARGPHGFYRVDEWPLTDWLRPGVNVVAIEVAGYNINSYYLLDQPSFLQAEVAAAPAVLAATGAGPRRFAARLLDQRLQKAQRYSFQRTFIEMYRMTPDSDRWRMAQRADWAEVPMAVQPAKALLPRRVPHADFAVHTPTAEIGRGQAIESPLPAKPWKDRALTNINPQFKGYPEKDLVAVPSLELQRLKYQADSAPSRAWNGNGKVKLAANQYRIYDLGTNLSGFIGAAIRCQGHSRVQFLFDEILTDGDVDFRRLSCVNVVTWKLAPGEYALESIEPYTLRYLKVLCREGEIELRRPFLREYSHAAPRTAAFAASDPRLNRLFAAGVETYRQNAIDIFMDCPSRERAGWLCDSFFTARVAPDLFGSTLVEDNFCENFLLPPQFPHLPEGMLPMCYPADHPNGNFIPNWALWLVMELEEYAARGGDARIVGQFRPKVLALFDYFRAFENSDGLLEKLKGWVFVEWSAANKFVQDVNYPTNMLYAGALEAAGRIYGLPEFRAKAQRIREVIRRQSFDGQFFVDNAVRKTGKLEVTRNRTEVCQYFAFFFGVADPNSHPELWQRLRDEFGPKRKENNRHPEVHLANAFIGNMLRMELLSQAGRNQQILDESIDYLLYMAERTGTLWENVDARASCDHGFASHIVHTLYRDVLGLYRVDARIKEVQLRLASVKLDHCRGTIPTADGPVGLAWRKTPGTLRYRLQLPQGYRAAIRNQSGLTLVKE